MNTSTSTRNQDWRFCQAILPKVSRTFALNIRVLRGTLHRSVLLSYLWCRIIDTIEDAPNFPADRKVAALREFAGFFESDGWDPEFLDTWVQSLDGLDGDADELKLVHHADRVGRCFAALPRDHVAIVKASVATMSRGMADYQARQGSGTQLIADERDLETYCYYVAGTVGEFLTRLFIKEFGRLSDERRQGLEARAVDFGLGLQMTNITKDLMVDIDRDWCYVPATYLSEAGIDPTRLAATPIKDHSSGLTARMAQKALSHLRKGFEYILLIPRRRRRVRLFCIWPLWMAMETLALLNRQGFQYQNGLSPKIERTRVKHIVSRSSRWFWSNAWLQREFKKLDPEGHAPQP